jgi:3-isopropylmalate/(R)-2-methylmalate dehydratase small subunit
LREADPNAELTVNLEKQSLTTSSGASYEFPIDGFSKHCLLNGLDELGYLLTLQNRITEYEARPRTV